MTQEHDWRECQPALLDTGVPAPDGRIADDHIPSLEVVWEETPDEDKRLFHEFCCHNQVDEEHVAAMQRISDRLYPWLYPDGEPQQS